jgi:hypothetical protein
MNNYQDNWFDVMLDEAIEEMSREAEEKNK